MKRSRIAESVSVSALVLAGICVQAPGAVAGEQTGRASAIHAGPPPAVPGTSQTAKLGQPLDLLRSPGNPINVTVVKVVNPDTAKSGLKRTVQGQHLESVEFRIVNNGHTAYQENPLIDITAADADAQITEIVNVGPTDAGPQLPPVLNLAPGQKAVGFVTYGVLDGDQIKTVVYALNGGLFGSSGQWSIS